MLRTCQLAPHFRAAAVALAAATTWILVPHEASAQTEDVIFRSAVGVTVSGNDLTKTSATNTWGNSGASSVQSIESNGFVEFSASGTAMLGLSKGDTDQGFIDIDFAVFAYAGTLQVYEAGNPRGSFGTVGPSDKLRVEVANNVVRYRKNGVVFYTSLTAARFPLLVDSALYTISSTLTDARIGQTSVAADTGVTVSEGTLTKTSAAGWNSGAVSSRRIRLDGSVEFTATETNKLRAAGLSNGDTDTTAADIDLAIVLKADATVEVQEGGVSRGVVGSYVSGDRFRVELQAGVVTYLQNGLVKYTSAVAPTYPLWADTALYDLGATLNDLVVSEISWTGTASVIVAAGTLTKTGSAGWNGGAASTASITSGDGFVEFTASETNTTRACGLADQVSSYDPAQVDFAIQLQSNADVRVYESGTLRGTFGTYVYGDRFRVEVQYGQVVYRKNGVVFYTSTLVPIYPLRVETSLDTVGGTLREVRLGKLTWKNEGGVAVWGYSLLDTGATGWGNSGAASTVELTSGNGSVEYTATDTYTYRMLGLSNGDTDRNYPDIDFALLANAGSVYVFQKGTQIGGALSTYTIGDRLRVAVEGGVVKYRRNGALLYTSTQAIVYPLLVDTALHTNGTAMTDIVLTGNFTPSSFVVTNPTLSPGGGTYSTAQTVAVTCPITGTDVHYTTNGVDPTLSDPVVACGGTVAVGQSLTLKVRGWKTGFAPSGVVAAVYTLVVTTPSLSPAPGTYTSNQTVTLSTVTPGATIRYTTDGTDPTAASTTYTAPVAVAVTTTLKAKAFKSGWTDTSTATGVYTLKVVTPTLTPGSGAYAGNQTVSVSTVTPSATVRYTTNGAEPTTSDLIVSGGTVAVTGSMTLKAKAWRSGWSDSDTGLASYSISQGAVATPTMTPTPGSFAGSVSVTLSTTTAGAIIRYTTDGTTPGLWSPLYTGALTLQDTTTIKAIALKADYVPSAVASGSYTRTTSAVATPTLQPGSGTYVGSLNVTVACATAGATIRYTTNGLDPTASDPSVVSGATVPVPRSMLLKVKAFKSGMTDSAVRRGNYVLGGGVAAGAQYSLAILSDRTVRAWGYNTSGQLGDGTTTSPRTSPVQVSVLTDVVAVAAGWSHSLAIKADGSVWAWGYNGYGQLGDGTYNSHSVPTQVAGLAGVVAVAAGDTHSLVLKADGTVWAWGNGVFGQLGDGAQTTRLTPVQVVNLTGVTRIAAGNGFSMALKTDGASAGSVWTWGINSHGRLGDGSAALTRAFPVRVLQGATGIGATSGGLHALAVMSDGTAWAWGYNLSGQVGDGTTFGRPSPVLVAPGPKGMKQIAAGGSHSLAIDGDGTVWTWGINGNGQLADGTAQGGRSVPGFVSWSRRTVAVSGGDNHSVTLREDGSVWTWGYNSVGQLGDGTQLQKTLPVRVLLPWDNSWIDGDPDLDGLTSRQELAIGTDPTNPDTNGDGIRDGMEFASGKSATNLDMDGDGATNAVELTKGTDPFRADTDGDGSNDAVDCFPLDPTRSQCPTPTPGDTTPPVITLTEPTSATLIGSVPP